MRVEENTWVFLDDIKGHWNFVTICEPPGLMFAGFIKCYMAVLLSLFLAIIIHMLVYWPRVGVFPNFVDSLVRGSDEHLRVASRACGGRAMHKVHVHSCHSKLVSWNAVFLLQRWGRARRNRHVSDHRKKGHWTAATSFAPDTLLFAGLMNCDMAVLLRPFLEVLVHIQVTWLRTS